MDRGHEWTFFQGRHTDGQQTHVKLLNITNNQGNTNYNHHEISPHTDAQAEAPILWPPHAKSQLIEKDSDAGKDRKQEEKGMTEDEIVGWYHRLNGHDFEQTLGDSGGQRSLKK